MSTLPIVKIDPPVVRTYLGARAEVQETHHDKSRLGLRTIITKWLDDATIENGGHKAGTVVRRIIKGDGRLASCVVIEADTVIA